LGRGCPCVGPVCWLLFKNGSKAITTTATIQLHERRGGEIGADAPKKIMSGTWAERGGMLKGGAAFG